MKVYYGAGEEFRKMVNRSNIGKIDYIVDTYPEKYRGRQVCGHKVYDNSIIKTLTSEDVVCVAANYDNFREIETVVKKLNPQVKIWHVRYLEWEQVLKSKLAEVKNAPEYYTINKNIELWLNSIDEEYEAWYRYLSELKAGGQQNELLKEKPFAFPYLKDLSIKEDDIIMDVGAGPFSKYGQTINGKRGNIITVDALAPFYRYILDDLDLKLPLYTEFAMMECLSGFYHSESANYVFANNTIDHCIDPARAIVELLEVVTVNGYLLLSHYEAEAEFGSYCGLHQWNFTEIDGDLILFNKALQKVNISKLLSDCCEIEIRREPLGWMGYDYRDVIIAKIHKKSSNTSKLRQMFNTKEYMAELMKKMWEKFTLVMWETKR